MVKKIQCLLIFVVVLLIYNRSYPIDIDISGIDHNIKLIFIFSIIIVILISLFPVIHHFSLHSQVKKKTMELNEKNEELKKRINERKVAEKALRDSVSFSYSLLNHSPNPILVVNSQNEIDYLNPALEMLSGYTKDELIGVEIPFPFWPKDKLLLMTQIFKKSINEGGKFDFEFVKKNGELFWVNITISPIKNENGALKFVLSIWLDITERKIAERNLRRRDALLQGVAESLNYLLTQKDPDKALNTSLNIMGVSTNVDRVYIFENIFDPDSGERSIKQKYQWVRKGVSKEINIDKIKKLSFNKIAPEWYNTLKSSKVINALVRRIPKSLRKILEERDIKSILLVPIMIEDYFYGIIGFDDCHNERIWDESEINILRVMAGSIGGQISQNNAQIEILKLNEELEKRVFERTAKLMGAYDELDNLNEVTKQISMSLDFKTVFNKIVEYLTVIYGFETCNFISVDSERKYISIEESIGVDKTSILWKNLIGKKIENTKESGGIIYQSIHDNETFFFKKADKKMIKNLKFINESVDNLNLLSLLILPIVDGNKVTGVFTLSTSLKEINLSADDIESVKRFANQIGLIVKNSRLYNEMKKTKDKLEKTLKKLKSAQKKIVVQEKMASLGELTAGIAHEIKNPLNFVNNFASISIEMLNELAEEIETLKDKINAQPLNNIKDIIDDLTINVGKIEDHGKRADSIVQGMLLHSRENGNEKQLTDINKMLREDINLAYHGLRAKDPSFNITINKEFDETIELINVIPQNISRVFINIITNGCYAANEKYKSMDAEAKFLPTIWVGSKKQADNIIIRIKDNGIGIPKDIRNKVFNPFFTTKPAGEGTGLGLSISYDIIVLEHFGEITIESEEGLYTEFIITIPAK